MGNCPPQGMRLFSHIEYICTLSSGGSYSIAYSISSHTVCIAPLRTQVHACLFTDNCLYCFLVSAPRQTTQRFAPTASAPMCGYALVMARTLHVPTTHRYDACTPRARAMHAPSNSKPTAINPASQACPCAPKASTTPRTHKGEPTYHANAARVVRPCRCPHVPWLGSNRMLLRRPCPKALAKGCPWSPDDPWEAPTP